MRYSSPMELADDDRAGLVSLTRTASVPSNVGFRAQIVLALGEGLSTAEAATGLKASPPTVRKWRDRYLREGLDGLWDYARSGRPPVVDEVAVVIATMEGPPEETGLTHWSSRELAKQMGISHNEIASIWRDWGLQPHRTESFKFSTDPELEAKIADVVGLYLDPPENAVVLCVDEKSQVQALERTQPVLPVAPGLAARRSRDYYRHGTTSLFAALEIATGKVFGECYQHHTNAEFLTFLKHVARAYPEGELHIIVDNYGAHQHENVQAWLDKKANQRITLHFTPTGCSWLNLVEVFFSVITRKAIRRGSFTSVKELVAAITNFIENHNKDCKPFVWTKPADVVIAKATSKQRTTFIKK